MFVNCFSFSFRQRIVISTFNAIRYWHILEIPKLANNYQALNKGETLNSAFETSPKGMVVLFSCFSLFLSRFFFSILLYLYLYFLPLKNHLIIVNQTLWSTTCTKDKCHKLYAMFDYFIRIYVSSGWGV